MNVLTRIELKFRKDGQGSFMRCRKAEKIKIGLIPTLYIAKAILIYVQ